MIIMILINIMMVIMILIKIMMIIMILTKIGNIKNSGISKASGISTKCEKKPRRALPVVPWALPEAQKLQEYLQNTRKTLAGLSRCHIGLSRRHGILRNRRFGSAGGTQSLEFACPSLPEAPSRSGSPIRLSRRLPESQMPEI